MKWFRWTIVQGLAASLRSRLSTAPVDKNVSIVLWLCGQSGLA